MFKSQKTTELGFLEVKLRFHKNWDLSYAHNTHLWQETWKHVFKSEKLHNLSIVGIKTQFSLKFKVIRLLSYSIMTPSLKTRV